MKRTAIVALTIGLILASTAWGADKVFQVGTGLWSTGTSWNPNGAPGAADNAIFDSGSGASAWLNATNAYARSLLFQTSGDFILSNTGSGGTMNIGAGGITVNPSAPSSVYITTGQYFYLDSDQTWTVAGGSTLVLGGTTPGVNSAGSLWWNAATRVLNKSGTGILRIQKQLNNTPPLTLNIAEGTFEYNSSLFGQVRDLAGTGTLNLSSAVNTARFRCFVTTDSTLGDLVGNGQFDRVGPATLTVAGVIGGKFFLQHGGQTDLLYSSTVTDHLQPTGTLSMAGGTFRLVGSDDASFSDAAGQLQVNNFFRGDNASYDAGVSNLRLVHGQNNNTATLTFTNTTAFAAARAAWIRFQGNDLGAASKIMMGSTGVLTSNILAPNMLVTDPTGVAKPDYASYDAANGVMSLDARGLARVNTINSSGAASHVDLLASCTLTANRSSLTARLNGDMTVDSGGKLWTVGGLLQVGTDKTVQITNGSIQAASGVANYTLSVYTEGNLVLASTFVPYTAGLAKAGPGMLTVTGNWTDATNNLALAEGGLDWETNSNTAVLLPNRAAATQLTNLTKAGTGTMTFQYGMLRASGTVWVKSGVLKFNENTTDPIGAGDYNGGCFVSGALQVDSGATYWSSPSGSNSTTAYLGASPVTGLGTLVVNTAIDGSNATKASFLADGIWKPGQNGAGVLNVIGGVSFRTKGTNYAGLNVSVIGSDANVASDYTRLALTGTLARLDFADLAVNVNNGLDLAGDVFTIVTTVANLSTGSTNRFHSITYSPNILAASATVQYGAGYALVSGLQYAPGLISGLKFSDSNANGVQDAGEPVLANWPITLTIGGVDTPGLTDGTGAFSFSVSTSNSVPYTITEGSVAGYRQTSTPTSFTGSVGPGETRAGLTFGNQQLSALSGMKFNDVNKNGVKDTGEVGLEGWTISLFNNSGTLTTTTDATGAYSFANVIPGSYTLTETGSTGWTQSFPVSGSWTGTVDSGATIGDLDFGNYVAVTDIPGDINRDRIVDQADYTVWYNHYGQTPATWADGDVTGDNIVDQADYTVWYNHYGQTGSNVPEPMTMALLAIGGLAMLRRRR